MGPLGELTLPKVTTTQNRDGLKFADLMLHARAPTHRVVFGDRFLAKVCGEGRIALGPLHVHPWEAQGIGGDSVGAVPELREVEGAAAVHGPFRLYWTRAGTSVYRPNCIASHV